MKFNSLTIKVLLFFSSSLISLLFIELGLRYFWDRPIHPVNLKSIGTHSEGREIYTLVPNDSYTNREGIKISTNTLGFRDIEQDVAKNGKKRIIFSGDSFTHATAINEKNRLSSIIRSQLTNDYPKQYQVFNMGISGNDAQQNLDLIEHFAPIIKPDLVVMAYVLNDALSNDGHYAKVVGLPIGQELKRFLYENLAFYRFLNFSAGQLYKVFSDEDARLQSHHDSREQATMSSYEESSENYKKLEINFSKFRQLGLSHNFKTVVMLWPMFDDETDDNYPYTGLHKKIKDLSERNGFAFLDLFSTFYEHDGKTLWVSEIDHHPNSLANKLAFETMYPFLKNELNSLLSGNPSA